MENHLDYLDVTDAFILTYGHRLTIKQLADYLGVNGFQVTAAANGQAMHQALGRDRVDALVLDLMLPGEDGLALTRALRTDPAWRELPILMLSARGEEIDRIFGLTVGVDDYLT